MEFKLNGGSLYRQDAGCGHTMLADNVYGTSEVQMTADEVAPILYNLNSSASASFEMKCTDLDLLNNLCDNPVPTGSFILTYNIPIMIQARWHKKARIRKKWLKRFGMKPDVVNVNVCANALEYHPGHILDEQYDDNGVCATFNSFEFEANKQEYVFRPDQKRRGIKIER